MHMTNRRVCVHVVHVDLIHYYVACYMYRCFIFKKCAAANSLLVKNNTIQLHSNAAADSNLPDDGPRRHPAAPSPKLGFGR